MAPKKKLRLNVVKAPPLSLLLWWLFFGVGVFVVLLVTQKLGGDGQNSHGLFWTIIVVCSAIGTIMGLLIFYRKKEGEENETVELTSEQLAEKKKAQQEKITAAVWSTSALSLVWLIFVTIFWFISLAWPELWDFIWNRNYEFTLATFVLPMLFSAFRSRAIKMEKKDKEDKRRVLVYFSAWAIILLNLGLWTRAVYKDEPIRAWWKELWKQEYRPPIKPTEKTAPNSSPLTPIILIAKRNEYSAPHNVLSTDIYDCSITFDGKVEIVPNGDQNMKFSMDKDGKRDDRNGGPVSRTLQFMSLEPDRDVKVTIIYTPKSRR